MEADNPLISQDRHSYRQHVSDCLDYLKRSFNARQSLETHEVMQIIDNDAKNITPNQLSAICTDYVIGSVGDGKNPSLSELARELKSRSNKSGSKNEYKKSKWAEWVESEEHERLKKESFSTGVMNPSISYAMHEIREYFHGTTDGNSIIKGFDSLANQSASEEYKEKFETKR